MLDAVEMLRACFPDVRVGLSTVAHVSGVGARALVELATAVPRLDYCAAQPAAAAGMVEIDPTLSYDDAHQVQPGAGTGLGGDVFLAPAVNYLSRYAEAPAGPPRLLTYGSMPENVYDLAALMDFAKVDGTLNLANPLLDRAALERGLNTTRFARGVMLADHPRLAEPIGFSSRRSTWTGVPSRRVVDRKDLTKRLLQAAGVAVPRPRTYATRTRSARLGSELAVPTANSRAKSAYSWSGTPTAIGSASLSWTRPSCRSRIASRRPSSATTRLASET